MIETSAGNYFFLIFLVTILMTRIFVHIKPIPSPTIKKLRLHHYMYGIILIIIAFILGNLFLFAVGMGLFVDELTYLIIKGKSHKDNYSKTSLIGTATFILLVFIFRNYLVKLI